MRKFRARALLCFSLSCTVLLGVTSSFAAPAARPADDDATVAIARERFKEGVTFFDQKQYEKARVAFLQAYALKKHPAVLLNLAQSELRSNHEVDAAKHFAAFLRESSTASEAERQAAEAGLSATKSVVALLDVNVDENGAEIYVDGSLEGVSPLPGALYVSPGAHNVEARKGGKTRAQQVNTSAGRQYMAELSFAPKTVPAEPIASASAIANEPVAEEPPAPEPDHPEPSAGRKPFFKWLVTSPVGLLGVGLTGVGLGGGIGFAIASKNSYDNADSVADQITTTAAKDSGMTNPDTRELCVSPSAWLMKVGYPENATPSLPTRSNQYSAACSKYQDNVNSGDSLKTWSTVGFVVGGVAAVGTVIYYFVDPNAHEGSAVDARRERRRIAIVPSIGPAQTGLTVIGSF
ncbi:MAG: hypothetical protein WDO74_06575 [Pseudomonadota bacterium]